MNYTEIIPNFKIVSEPVVSKIRSNTSDGSGGYCKFFKLDEKRGLKLYSYRTFYDDAIQAHKLYAEHFPAPKIYEENLIFVFDDCTYYGYIVEIAQVLRGILGLDLNICDVVEDESYCDYLEIKNDLERMFEANGFTYNDFHSGNIGLIGENWMLIDFGGFRTTKSPKMLEILEKVIEQTNQDQTKESPEWLQEAKDLVNFVKRDLNQFPPHPTPNTNNH